MKPWKQRCVVLFTTGLFGLPLSCGQVGNIQGKGARAYDTSSDTTLENFSSWSKHWRQGEWVVTIGENPKERPQSARWRKVILQSLLETAGVSGEIGEDPALLQQASAALGPILDLSFASLQLGTLPQLLKSMNEPPLGFAFVNLDSSRSQLFLQKFGGKFALPANATPQQISYSLAAWQMQSLQSIPGVVFAEPNLVTKLNLPKNFNTPDGYTNETSAPEFNQNSVMAETLRRVKADKAYEWVDKEKLEPAEVNVAVLDTGVDYLHPELKENMFLNPRETPGNGVDDDNNCHIDDIHGIDATYDCSRDNTVQPRPGAADLLGPAQPCPKRIGPGEDDLTSNCGHGTHVAGIIAAKQGGNLSSIGICPTCKIISVRVSERCLMPDSTSDNCVKPKEAYDKATKWEADAGIADTSQIRGLAYLFNLKQKDRGDKLVTNVVNMSLGKYFRSRAMAYIIRNLERLNIVVVAAAGNDNTDIPSYPAAYTSVVSVCATGASYHRGIFGKAIFSNFGDWVDICAPGVDIYSTVPGTDSGGTGRFGEKSGTSQATPFVAGAIGYLLSVFKDTKSGTAIVRQMKAASDFQSLYSSDFNEFYKACYAKSDVCDYLLGSGFLDLFAAVKGANESPYSESNGRAVTSGCVVSSVAMGQGPFIRPEAWSSLPFVLGIFALLAWVSKALRRALFR